MIFSLFLLCFSLHSVQCLNSTSEQHLLPIDKLLNQQYDHRQLQNNRTISPIRSWKKSNSIEILKKLIGNRQRSIVPNRTSTTTTTTTTTTTAITSAFFVRIKSKIDLAATTTDEISSESSTTTTTVFPQTSTLKSTSSNTTLIVIILICSFSGFLFLALIFTFLLRFACLFILYAILD